MDAVAEAALKGLPPDVLSNAGAYVAAQRTLSGDNGPGPFLCVDMRLDAVGDGVLLQPGAIFMMNFNRWAGVKGLPKMAAAQCLSEPVKDPELVKLIKTSVNSSCCRMHIYMCGDHMTRHSDGPGLASAERTKLTLIRTIAREGNPFLERWRTAVEK